MDKLTKRAGQTYDYFRKYPHYIGATYAVLALLIITCILLRPIGLGVSDGLSYFGIYRRTIIPYSIGLMIFAYMIWRLSYRFKGEGFKSKLSVVLLRITSLSAIGIAITPYNLVFGIHTFFGALMFFCQFLFALLMAEKTRLDHLISLYVLGLAISGLLAVYYLASLNGDLKSLQIIYQIFFAALLMRTVKLELT